MVLCGVGGVLDERGVRSVLGDSEPVLLVYGEGL